VEVGYTSDHNFTLRSALAAPIQGKSGVIGVLGLYRTAQEAFTKNDLDIVETLIARLGVAIESGGSSKEPAAAMKAHA
jgi:GAF domain-containing protein